MKDDETQAVLAEKIRALEVPSISRWLRAALNEWGIIGIACGVAIYLNNPLGYILAVLVVGVRRHALTLLGHDGAHFLISRDKDLNDFLVECFVFWPSFVGVTAYRMFHVFHHKYLGTLQDLELLHKKLTAPAWDLPMTKWGMVKRVCLDLVGGGTKEVLVILRMVGIPQRPRDVIGPLVWWGVVLGALYLLGGMEVAIKVFFIWNVSMFTSFITVFRLRMWTEHLGTASVYRIAATWFEKQFLPYNTDHHWEHHTHMNVPFYNLPRVRELYPNPPIETVGAVLKRHYTTTVKILSGQPAV